MMGSTARSSVLATSSVHVIGRFDACPRNLSVPSEVGQRGWGLGDGGRGGEGCVRSITPNEFGCARRPKLPRSGIVCRSRWKGKTHSLRTSVEWGADQDTLSVPLSWLAPTHLLPVLHGISSKRTKSAKANKYISGI